MARPNFFIIGAMKSGTTSLHSYLATHPEIFMCSPKEPSYFVERRQLAKVWREMERRGYWRSEDHYLALFSAAKDEKIIGESSTAYTKLNQLDGVARRIADFAPDARLLYIMRDPMERTVSHYFHMVENHGETRTLLRALQEDPTFLDFSNYAMQLRPYIDLFGADRIFTTTFESFNAAPIETIKEIFRWLGVDDSFTPDNLDEKYNATPDLVARPRGLGLLNKFRTSWYWERMRESVPQSLRNVAKSLSHTEVAKGAIDTTEGRRYMAPIVRGYIADLTTLLSREFPEWKSAHHDEAD